MTITALLVLGVVSSKEVYAPPAPNVTQVHVSFQGGLSGTAIVYVVGQVEGAGTVSDGILVNPNQETYNLHYPFVSGTVSWTYLIYGDSYSFTVQQGQSYVEDLYVYINTFSLE